MRRRFNLKQAKHVKVKEEYEIKISNKSATF
jgi:hypothetical protein